jgi:hypothetical protein
MDTMTAGATLHQGGASRYFAAAAYHDAGFRHKVLAFVRDGWFRARAPEYGIDERFVIDHCRRAERRERLRDALMVAAFLAFTHSPLAWLLAQPDDAAEILSYFSGNLALGLLAAALVLFAERLLSEHFTTARHFARDATPSGPAGRAHEPAQNLVVYGGYSPFVGSGYDVGGWSFSVNLERTRELLGQAAEARSFAPRDMWRFVESRLDRLRIEGLRYQTVLFADGRMVREQAARLSFAGSPPRHLPAQVIEEMDDAPHAGMRAYLCVNVVDWSGELVLSVYLRCKKGETNLFVEASYFLVPPPKRSFFRIDEADARLRVMTVLRLLTRSGVLSAVVLVAAVLRLLAWAQSPLLHWLARRRVRRAMQRNPRFNCGAVTSIRQLGMENYYRVYFQQLDKERHVKTIEQCTIDAIVAFLDQQNIDTSDIRDRRQAILNNGVIVAGGELNAENLAVGTGARAMISRLGARLGQQAGGPSQSNARRAGAAA